MSRAEIYWLGVHKTGTTFLQACLDASRPALERHGIAYTPLDAFRAAHTRPLLDRAEALPPPSSPGEGRRLIFDENILGLVQDVATPEGLYPAGAWRADEMADHLRLAAPQIILGLRGFADFLPSLYCESLKSVPFQGFEAFQRTPLEKLSWQPLVAGLQRAFRGATVTLYRAEDLRGHEIELLARLLDLPPEALHRADHDKRPGFSQRAIDMMIAEQAVQPVGPERAKQLAQAHPRKPGAPGFDPWSVEERAQLDVLYETDIAAFREWPGLRMLDLG
ncbi:hypothetical protein NHG85_17910 [Limimaricola sp. ASW11-118]|uniref:Sulfotransferase family protein n=1 Tax=Limimaricola litoreus TaxID=2955316 RepID=A0A9X2JRF3_9RHOB|nr:hypothetical protein [Limimaricola litoreus]MCP1170385.1 hypothetical protein [Limimaricola litoreus]